MNGTVTLDDLELFRAVGELSSFRLAAQRLNLPPSTLSRRIRQLEERFGAQLLRRSSRRVQLTVEGTRLLARVTPSLRELSAVVESEREAGGEPAGPLRVTATQLEGSRRIAPALMAYAERYPKVRVELILSNSLLPLLEESIALAFRAGPIRDENFIARKLWTLPFELFASPALIREHFPPSRRLDRITPKQLEGKPAVLTRSQASWELIDSRGNSRRVTPERRFSVDDPRVALDAARAGLGIVAAPRDAVAPGDDSLKALDLGRAHLVSRALYAVYPATRPLPPRVRSAIDFVVAHCSPQ
ncbi:MAG: LysR family transcriptional regulator [Polyangiaceae bacterium]